MAGRFMLVLSASWLMAAVHGFMTPLQTRPPRAGALSALVKVDKSQLTGRGGDRVEGYPVELFKNAGDKSLTELLPSASAGCKLRVAAELRKRGMKPIRMTALKTRNMTDEEKASGKAGANAASGIGFAIFLALEATQLTTGTEGIRAVLDIPASMMSG